MKRTLAALSWLLLAAPALAGGYFNAPLSNSTYFIVVHPPGYSGAGGTLTVKLCAETDFIRSPLNEALQIWRAAQVTAANCKDCKIIEETSSGTGTPPSMSSVLLHELGHCIFGLGHNNWFNPQASANSSFSATFAATSINPGSDTVRGTRDDSPTPLPGSRLIHWFRTADNDPFQLSAPPVDISNFSRQIAQLPSGHNWPESANRAVADLRGHPETQSVMYSHLDRAQFYRGLAADELNTINFARSGIDEQAGTADDYTIDLQLTSCLEAQVMVRFVSLGPNFSNTFGICRADIVSLQPGLPFEVHQTLVPFAPNPVIYLDVNADWVWDHVHASDFETGTTSDWSASFP